MTEAEIRALVDDIPGAAVYHLLRHPDGSGRYLYVSAGIQQIVGMTAEQVMADAPAFEALILEEDRGRLRATADAAMATMSPFDIEIRLRTLRGDMRWVHCRATPRERLADGSVIWAGVVVDVTERKRVDEELREREALLRTLSDNLPEGTIYQVVRRPDGSNYFPYISEGQASTYGLTREQVIADPSRVYGLVVDEDLTKLRTVADESLRTLTAMEVECRQRTARGEERWVQIRARPRRLPDGSTLWDAVSLDITERKRAEEALRERETQLRHLADNLPDGVIYQVVRQQDGSNYFPYMSAGLEQTFRVTASEAMSNPAAVYDRILPEDLGRLRAAADESIRTMTPFDVECRLRTPDGAERCLSVRGRPSPLTGGAMLWDAIALDITERKRTEEALRDQETQLRKLGEDLQRSEERYRLLFERNFVGIFRTRADGILMECNDAFARILGYHSAAETRGCNVLAHYAAATDRDLIVTRLSAGEDVTGVELIVRRRDGSLVPVAMSVRRIVDQEGSIHEGVLVDLTERKQAEEAATLRSVAELANGAAHEINNPLTTIVGQLTLISEGGDITGRIERMRVAADRIRDIVKHMERITRLERSTDWPDNLPRMLDIRRSGAQQEDIGENP